MRPRGRPKEPAPAVPRIVVVGEAPDWRAELGDLLGREGYAIHYVARLEEALTLPAGGSLRAIFLAAGPLAATDILLLQSIRAVSRRTAVVVVAETPTDPDLKRAFESGATSFLSWPAAPEAIRLAMGADPASPAAPGVAAR